MEIIWPFILSFLAGFSTLIGVIPIFTKIKHQDEFITFSLAFSLSVMITISVFDLIPSSLRYLDDNIILFIIPFLLGVFIVNIINKLIEKEKGSTNNLYKVGILSFIALVLHNLPEGILTFLSTYKDFHLGLSLCVAIAMHNIPEGISIAVPIYYGTKSRGLAVKTTLLSAIAEPLGAFLSFMLLKNYVNDKMISIFLVLVAGIMITLSINKMLPEALVYQKKKPLACGLLIGLVVSILSIIIL